MLRKLKAAAHRAGEAVHKASEVDMRVGLGKLNEGLARAQGHLGLGPRTYVPVGPPIYITSTSDAPSRSEPEQAVIFGDPNAVICALHGNNQPQRTPISYNSKLAGEIGNNLAGRTLMPREIAFAVALARETYFSSADDEPKQSRDEVAVQLAAVFALLLQGMPQRQQAEAVFAAHCNADAHPHCLSWQAPPRSFEALYLSHREQPSRGTTQATPTLGPVQSPTPSAPASQMLSAAQGTSAVAARLARVPSACITLPGAAKLDRRLATVYGFSDPSFPYGTELRRQLVADGANRSFSPAELVDYVRRTMDKVFTQSAIQAREIGVLLGRDFTAELLNGVAAYDVKIREPLLCALLDERTDLVEEALRQWAAAA